MSNHFQSFFKSPLSFLLYTCTFILINFTKEDKLGLHALIKALRALTIEALQTP